MDAAHILRSEGFVKIDLLVPGDELERLRATVYGTVTGIKQEVPRIDIAPSTSRRNNAFENITNIPNISRHIPELRRTTAYSEASNFARRALGADMQLAFDMVFFKGPHTQTPTPFHQDAAYWPPMEDERAAQCWIALDDVDLDNGCLWFVPASHLKPLRAHLIVDEVSGLSSCACSEEEALPVPLKSGSCTFHLGKTIHYSRGNSTSRPRCALVLTFRPSAMIKK